MSVHKCFNKVEQEMLSGCRKDVDNLNQLARVGELAIVRCETVAVAAAAAAAATTGVEQPHTVGVGETPLHCTYPPTGFVAIFVVVHNNLLFPTVTFNSVC